MTLTIAGRLRGCIGTLEAYQPLAKDVRDAIAAALEDYRFSPLGTGIGRREIEVFPSDATLRSLSKLMDLPGLQPFKDGVVLQDDHQATFCRRYGNSSLTRRILDPSVLENGLVRQCLERKVLKVGIYSVENSAK